MATQPTTTKSVSHFFAAARMGLAVKAQAEAFIDGRGPSMWVMSVLPRIPNVRRINASAGIVNGL
jgi:hypothetical protein